MRTKAITSRAMPAVLAALALTGATAPVTYAQNARESAAGHGTLPATTANGREVKRQFSFSARREADGTAKGQAVLHNPAFDGANGAPYQLKLNISCMRVVGNIAIFGGSTSRTNDPNLVDAAFFTVQDNGEPGKGRDKISRVFFFDDNPNTTGDPALCELTGPTDFPLETITGGNVQVKDGTVIE